MSTNKDLHILAVGERVEYLVLWGRLPSEWKPIGIVVGFGEAYGRPKVLVHLDHGFWSEGREYFVSILSFDPSNIRLSEEP